MSYRLRLLLLLTCAFVAGIGSLALTIQAARENSKDNHSPLPSLDGLVALRDPLDLGDVPQDILDGTFELVNKSKKPVRMIQIVKACNCTEIEAPSTNIAPGETVNISFKWNSSGVRGIRGSSFTVFYSEEDRPGLRSLTLSVKGNVLPLFDFAPEKLEFTAGKAETKTVKLVPHETDSDIIIEEIAYSLAAFKVEKLSDREIAVTFLPEEWIDDPEKIPYIALKTNSEKERQCDVYINVRK